MQNLKVTWERSVRPDRPSGWQGTIAGDVDGNAIIVLLYNHSVVIVNADTINFAADGNVLQLQDAQNKNVAVFGRGQWISAQKASQTKLLWIAEE